MNALRTQLKPLNILKQKFFAFVNLMLNDNVGLNNKNIN